MDERADSGAILVQEPFPVHAGDCAADVESRLSNAIDRALDRWVPRLTSGEWERVPQQETLATYYGRRAPDDGLIEWSWEAEEIEALIRAAGRPHPGAYSYAAGSKLIVWRASLEKTLAFRGAVGRILSADHTRGSLVQTGKGLLWLTEVEFQTGPPDLAPPALKVGMRLGYAPQDEIHVLRNRLQEMEGKIEKLQDALSRLTGGD
jgi:methionyl-tRNA formyltransferase